MSRCNRQPGGPCTEELISGVEHGVYVVGDKTWSIDMQRYNFQFTGQRFFRIARAAGGPAAGRGVPGHHDGFLGVDGGGRRPADLRARGGVQLRQGPAGPDRGGDPRLSQRCSATSGC